MRLLAMVLLAAFAVPAAARIVTVDFDDRFIVLRGGETAVVDDGFSVAVLSGSDLGLATDQNGLIGNGTRGFYYIGTRGAWELRETERSAVGFDLLRLDIGGSFDTWPNFWASSVRITGYRRGGGSFSYDQILPTVAQSITIDLPTNFRRLSRIRFTPRVNVNRYRYANDFGVDNIVLQLADAASAGSVGVPEPAGWTMMIAGFGFVGIALRQRSARKLTERDCGVPPFQSAEP